MARTPAQAVAAANSITRGYGNLCLQFVRTCYGVGAKYPSAISAWNHARVKHRTSSTNGIPVGAPIFFSGSRYGHVAIYVGGGNMRTTNSATNRIHTHSVSSWVRAGYNLLGWTEDLNGVRVFSAPAPAPKPTPAPSGGLAVDGQWGPSTTRRLQQHFGTPQDGVISGQVRGHHNAGVHSAQWGRGGSQLIARMQGVLGVGQDGYLGPNTIKALQRRMGTPADGVISPVSQAVMEMQRRLNRGTF